MARANGSNDGLGGDGRPNPRAKGALTRLLPVAVIAAALGAFFYFELDQYFSLDALRTNRQALDAWVAASPLLAIGLFIAAYAAAVAISFPGASILTVFGGFLFGYWPGAPAVVVAATIGASLIFLVAKSALGDLVAGRAGGFIKRMEAGFRENELSYMFLLRLVPAFPFWAVNIAAGVVGVSLRNFLIGTFFGIIPGSVVYVGIGAAARAAFAAGETVTLTGILTKPTTLAPIIGLALLAALPIVVKRVNKKAARRLETSAGAHD